MLALCALTKVMNKKKVRVHGSRARGNRLSLGMDCLLQGAWVIWASGKSLLLDGLFLCLVGGQLMMLTGLITLRRQ